MHLVLYNASHMLLYVMVACFHCSFFYLERSLTSSFQKFDFFHILFYNYIRFFYNHIPFYTIRHMAFRLSNFCHYQIITQPLQFSFLHLPPTTCIFDLVGKIRTYLLISILVFRWNSFSSFYFLLLPRYCFSRSFNSFDSADYSDVRPVSVIFVRNSISLRSILLFFLIFLNFWTLHCYLFLFFYKYLLCKIETFITYIIPLILFFHVFFSSRSRVFRAM